MGGFLVRSAERVAIVDAGVGQSPVPLLTGGAFLESLASHGVTPEEVTDVVFTHLHRDHIGWASDAGRPCFPTPPTAATPGTGTGSWAPPAGRGRRRRPTRTRNGPWSCCRAWPTGSRRGPPTVPCCRGSTWAAPGHTPGSAIVVVSDGAARALLLGDVAHCPIELLDDEWAGIADVDPALAQRTRVALARELEGVDVPVAAAHFPGLRFGRLLEGQGKRQWVV